MATTASQREPIAVIGSSCRFPGPATSPSKLWEFLKTPCDVAQEIPKSRFNVEGFFHSNGEHHGTTNTRKSYFLHEDHRRFDASFFQFHPREAETMDPQQRLLLETVYETLESAGLTIEGMQGSQTSVFVGGMSYDFRDSLSIRDPASIPEYNATGTHASMLAARISYFFDWKGPSMSIDTACSSSLVAVHQAVQTLRNGEATVAVAAGSNLILGPEAYIALSNLHMLSPQGHIRMWDADADGYARGEGFAAVMLKTLSQALTDGDKVECIIRGTGVNQDGKTTGITMPNALAQATLIQQTYSRAGLDLQNQANHPQYFEAHGTGTSAGDPIEAEAIHRAFFAQAHQMSDVLPASLPKEAPLFVGSIKTVLGHLEGAAGIAGLLKASLAVQKGIIPPNMHFNSLNPKIKPYYGNMQIPTTQQLWPKLASGAPRRASVNSFGFGGTNAHCIVESFLEPTPVFVSRRIGHKILMTPMTISAKSEHSLVAHVRAIASFVKDHDEVDLEDLAWTLQLRRSHFAFRASFSGLTRKEIRSSITSRLSSSGVSSLVVRPQSHSRMLGVFTGQGAQHALMAKELIEGSAAARQILERLETSLAKLPDPPAWSMKEELLAPASVSRIGEAALSQPICTAIQIILIDILRIAGITFEAVVGHSSGEIAGAYAAGFFSASDAIRIAYYRGLHAKLACGEHGCQGAMLAVGMSFDEATIFCAQFTTGRTSVAASNAPSSSTLSGDSDAIDAAKAILDERKTFARRLLVDTAYHSHHMQPCAEPYLKSLVDCGIEILQDGGTRCKYISSVYAVEMSDGSKFSPAYWVENMIRPVLFSQAVERAMSSQPFDIAIEIGAHPTLRGPIMETLSKNTSASVAYHGTLIRGQNSVIALSTTLGFVWERRRPSVVDFDSYRRAWYGGSYSSPSLVKDLPSYSWDHHQILYRESRISRNYLSQAGPVHESLGSRASDDSDHERRWRNYISIKEVPWIAGHKIQGQVVVPAMWYAVMVLEASKKISPVHETKYIEIRDFQITKAVTPDEGSSVETIFTLKQHQRESSRNVINAEFSCSAGSSLTAPSLDLIFEGHLIIHLGNVQSDSLPSFSENGPLTSVNSIDVDRFYSYLQGNGLEYSGTFRALKSVQRNGRLAVTTAEREQSQFMVHPSTLDLGLQSLLAAIFSTDDDGSPLLLVPRSIRRLLVNPGLCQMDAQTGSQITLESVVTEQLHSGIRGDTEIFNDRRELEVQFEDVLWVPLTEIKSTDDKKLFAKTVWQTDVFKGAPIQIPEYSLHEQDLVAACDRMAWYYYRNIKAAVTHQELAESKWHHQRLFEYIDYLLPQLSEGAYATVKEEWANDTPEQIAALTEQYQDSADIQLIRAVGENLPLAIIEQRTILEFMMEDNRLNQYYKYGLGYEKAYAILEIMIKQITHQYPRMNILEVGAGTGGATQHALDAMKDAFLSYTFSDVSSGFFEKAQETFYDRKQKMVFKTLDLERGPKEQDFEEHSFDLVLGSLVLHATKSLSSTLSYVRSLLKPGGYLLLVEGSESTLRSGFMMSGLPGWWVGGEDRKWSPMISHEKWDSLLRSNGFSGIDVIAQDSGLPNTNLGAVFVTQAVDDNLVSLLRNPLGLVASASSIERCSILGGVSSECSTLRDRICPLLQPCVKKLSLFSSVEEMDSSPLHTGSSMLCLTELDEPVFKDLTPFKLKALQHIFTQANKVLVVLRTDGVDHPYSSALLGLLRSLRLEIPHLRIQVLGVQGETLDAQVIAETFLRLVHMPLSNASDEMLWSFEPELTWGDGMLYIPRIVPDLPRNERINLHRRLICAERKATAHPIEVSVNDSSYLLRDGRITVESGIEHIIVSQSTLQRINVFSSQLFLCLGVSQGSGKQVVALSESNCSIVTPPKEWIYATDVLQIGKERDYLSAVAYCLFSQTFLDGLPTGCSILVHEATLELRDMISREALRRGGICRAFFSSSQRSSAESTIYIHALTPRRQIKQLLKSLNMKVFVDCSQQELSAHIRACFPEAVYIIPFANARGSENAIMLLEEIGKALSHAMSSVSMGTCGFGQSLDYAVIDAADIPDMKMDQSLRIVDWTDPKNLSVQTRDITDSYRLFSSNKTYLFVGLTGDLGQSLCEWAIEQGCRYIVLTSRSPRVEQDWINEFSSSGAVVKIYALDVTDMSSLRKFYAEISQELPPVAGVAQGAMVLRDGSFYDMSYEAMDECLRPKVHGSRNLDELFSDVALEFFIMFSSIAWVVGNPGQSNYSAANGFMAGLAKSRRKRGLAASVMSIGVVAGVGYLARTKGGHEHEHARRRNVMTISEQELHTIFAEAIVAGRPDSGHDTELVTGLDGSIDTSTTPKDTHSAWLSDPRVSHLIFDKGKEMQQLITPSKAAVITLKQQLASVPGKAESSAVLVRAFSTKLERMLQLQADTVFETTALVEMGVDSLLAVEIRSWFVTELGVDMPVLKILGGASVLELSSHALALFEGTENPNEEKLEANAEGEPTISSSTEDSASVDSARDTPSTDYEIVKMSRKEVMSYTQARMWRLNEYTWEANVNNLSWAYRIQGRIDLSKFQHAFRSTVQNYESLRTRFFVDEQSGTLTQETMSSTVVELGCRKVASEADIDAEFERTNALLYDLPNGKTFSALLLSLSDESHVLIGGFHHIVIDTRSIEILLADLDRSYRQLEVRPSFHQLADYAAMEQQAISSGAWKSSIFYWKEQHINSPAIIPLFPFCCVQERQPMHEYRLNTVQTNLSTAKTTHIKKTCAELKISPFHLHTTVLQVLLMRVLGPCDLCIGSVDANRSHHSYRDTFGPMFNYLPLRFNVDPRMSFADLARITRNKSYEAQGHAQVPFDVILDSVGVPRMPDTHHALYQVQINYLQHTIEEVPLGDGLTMQERNASGVEVSYDFCVSVLETRHGARVLFQTQKYLYDEDHVCWLRDAYFRILDAFLEDANTESGKLDIGDVPGAAE